MAQYGFSALNYQLNANANNNFANANAIAQANLIRAVRVLSIVLDETHPRFKELGEWNGLGIIEYEDINNPLPSPSLPTARPLAGNFKNLPEDIKNFLVCFCFWLYSGQLGFKLGNVLNKTCTYVCITYIQSTNIYEYINILNMYM